MREDRLVQMNERETRYLDVLFLGHRQQEVQELPLDLQDLDHLEHAAARGIYRAGPGPGPRIALIADLRDFREVHRADEVRDIRRGGVVRSVGADTVTRGFREEHPLDGHTHE